MCNSFGFTTARFSLSFALDWAKALDFQCLIDRLRFVLVFSHFIHRLRHFADCFTCGILLRRSNGILLDLKVHSDLKDIIVASSLSQQLDFARAFEFLDP